jgi:hypothetical protein
MGNNKEKFSCQFSSSVRILICAVLVHIEELAVAPRTGHLIFTRKQPVLRQNSIRTENSVIPCRDRCPHRGYPFIPRPPRFSRGEAPARRTCIYRRMREPGRFRDPTLVRIRQPDRTGGAALPVVHEKGRDLRLWCDFFRPAFPSPVRDACGPRGSSEYTQRAAVSVGVRQRQ